jgi:hypothetical protein
VKLRPDITHRKQVRLFYSRRDVERGVRLIFRSFYLEWTVVAFVNVVPLLRRDLSFVREVTIFVDHFRFDDIEYLLRIYISALMTFALIAINEVDTSFEVNDRIDWISIVDL